MNNQPTCNNSIRLLVLSGLFAALITVGTMISFPIAAGQGFINLGDAVINVSIYVLGGWHCAAVAAVGSAMADLILGFPLYMPASFLVKGLMGLFGVLLAKRIRKPYLVFAVSGLVMPIGYFLYEVLLSLLKVWNLSVAVYDIPWNFIQYLVGGVIGSLSIAVLAKLNVINFRE